MAERRVEIVWANASRAAAHQLDFRLEEWRLRREAIRPIAEQPFPEIALRDYSAPPSLTTAIEWRDDLKKRVVEIDTWLGLRSARTLGKQRAEILARDFRRVEILHEREYCVACLRCLNDFTKRRGQRKATDLVNLVEKSGNPADTLLSQEHLLLKRLLEESQFSLTPSDRITIDAADEYLNRIADKQENSLQ